MSLLGRPPKRTLETRIAMSILHELRLRFGSAAAQPALSFPLTPITVFVGPNNSGKSKVLQEIVQFTRGEISNANAKILDRITFAKPPPAEAAALISRLTLQPHQTET